MILKCGIMALLLTSMGCYYFSVQPTKLSTPIPRPEYQIEYGSEFNVPTGKRLHASIGDNLFDLRRFKTSNKEIITCKPPTGTPFPSDSTWMGTHAYKGLTVYTSEDYYQGTVGLVLDSNDCFAVKEAFIQVSGGHKGRGWRAREEASCFALASRITIDHWGVRYGGLNEGKYVFEILKTSEAKVIEILQSITIDERSFLEGFTIRNVTITGLKADQKGVIEYQVQDELFKTKGSVL